MRIILTSEAGFSEALVTWHANAPVGARGALECTWFEWGERRSVSTTRWPHPFDDLLFTSVEARLAAMPNPLGSVVDDVGGHAVTCVRPHRTTSRTSYRAAGIEHQAQLAFHELWLELVNPVEAELLRLGLPPNLRIQCGFGTAPNSRPRQ